MAPTEVGKYISVSKDLKYCYPIDSISLSKAFCPMDYFLKNLEKKYGNDIKRFLKEYTTRETKKYLAEGHTPEQIKEIASKYKNNKLPKIVTKIKNHPDMPKKARKKRLSAHVETTKVITNEDGSQQTVRVFPWSQDPQNYFKGTPVTLSIGEMTKDACMRPDIFLDQSCFECNLYSECCCELKILKK